MWPQISSRLPSSLPSLLPVPCLILISHPIPHVHPSPLISPAKGIFPRLSLLHHSPTPAMHHIVAWIDHRHRGKAQKKSVVQCGTITPQPKEESEKKKDVEATGPCHVDLSSGDVNPLNSTSRSNDEDVSTCNGDVITGRYLLAPCSPI